MLFSVLFLRCKFAKLGKASCVAFRVIKTAQSVVVYKSSPVTGLEWSRGFQEVKVPRFHDNGTGRW